MVWDVLNNFGTNLVKSVTGLLKKPKDDDEEVPKATLTLIIEQMKEARKREDRIDRFVEQLMLSSGKSRDEITKEIDKSGKSIEKMDEETLKKLQDLLDFLGMPNLELNQYELGFAFLIEDTDKLKVDWTEIGGLERVENEIKEKFLKPLKSKDKQVDNGILFYGPAGCGKSLLTAATVKAAGSRYLKVRVSHIYDKEIGEQHKKIEALFSLAKKIQPTIIFIDEIDSFLGEGSSKDTKETIQVKKLFLSLWAGIDSKVSNDKVIIMGSTIRRGDLDDAVLRRMPLQYEVPLPDVESRKKIMKKVLRTNNVSDNIEWEKLLNSTEGWSGDDIARLCKDAIVNAENKTEFEEQTRYLTMEDFLAAIEKIRSSKAQLTMERRYGKGEKFEKIQKLSASLCLPNLELNDYELALTSQLIDAGNLKTEWSNIGGLDDIETSIKQGLIRILENSVQQLPEGILFYGPPGCGKTMLASATAKEKGFRILNIHVSHIYDEKMGEPQKKTEALFSLAKKIQPAIIFIDEIDSFLGERSSKDTEISIQIKNIFLSLWDGMVSKASNDKIIIMGTTNRLKDLDEAIVRRFSQKYEVPLPDLEKREKIMKVIMMKEKVSGDIEWKKLAEKTEGWSGDDLANLCRKAVANSEKGTISGEDPRSLTMEDFMVEIEKTQSFKMQRKVEKIYDTIEEIEKAKKILQALGISDLNFNKHELRVAAHIMVPSELKTKLSDIGGLKNVLKVISAELIRPLKSNPDLLPDGVLFYGPPGCGKTLLATAIAKEAGIRLLIFNVSEAKSDKYGETDKMIEALFSVAKQVQPVIVFIDEIDAILGERTSKDHEITTALKTQFLTLWDGATSKETKNKKIIMMGATNMHKNIDKAIARRLSLKIEVPLPNKDERVQILKILLADKKVSEDIDLNLLSSKTEGWSGSELKEVCRAATVFASYDTDEGSTETRPLQVEDFEEGIKRMENF